TFLRSPCACVISTWNVGICPDADPIVFSRHISVKRVLIAVVRSDMFSAEATVSFLARSTAIVCSIKPNCWFIILISVLSAFSIGFFFGLLSSPGLGGPRLFEAGSSVSMAPLSFSPVIGGSTGLPPPRSLSTSVSNISAVRSVVVCAFLVPSFDNDPQDEHLSWQPDLCFSESDLPGREAPKRFVYVTGVFMLEVLVRSGIGLSRTKVSAISLLAPDGLSGRAGSPRKGGLSSTTNLVATVDSVEALNDATRVFAKCQALFNKQNQSTQCADQIKEILGRYLIVPKATR
ncbi:Uncharacterized protein FWK35_00027248, partial [Aphis craccivora]